MTRKEWAFVLELLTYCAANDHKQQCYVMEKLWAENAFDFVYSPVDLTFILSHRKNLEELGIVTMEAIQSTSDRSLADAEFKRLEKLIKNTKVHLRIIIPNSTS